MKSSLIPLRAWADSSLYVTNNNRREMDMKKYMTPEMEVVEIEVRKMLCASDGTNTGVTIPDEDTPGGPSYDD